MYNAVWCWVLNNATLRGTAADRNMIYEVAVLKVTLWLHHFCGHVLYLEAAFTEFLCLLTSVQLPYTFHASTSAQCTVGKTRVPADHMTFFIMQYDFRSSHLLLMILMLFNHAVSASEVIFWYSIRKAYFISNAISVA
jgi:hypothetical protein